MPIEILGMEIFEHPKDIWFFVSYACFFFFCQFRLLPAVHGMISGTGGKILLLAALFPAVLLATFLGWLFSDDGGLIEEITKFISHGMMGVWLLLILALIFPQLFLPCSPSSNKDRCPAV